MDKRPGWNSHVWEDARIRAFQRPNKPLKAGGEQLEQADKLYESLDRTACTGWRPQ
jgi:hypothetical protein